ncbi:hypothetical protein WEH80_01985 [Actinomycetes bacterium KLBMP 9759]
MLLDDDGDGTVDPITALIERLWAGRVGRHGGGLPDAVADCHEVVDIELNDRDPRTFGIVRPEHTRPAQPLRRRDTLPDSIERLAREPITQNGRQLRSWKRITC